jgi:hypothetical protein
MRSLLTEVEAKPLVANPTHFDLVTMINAFIETNKIGKFSLKQ